MGQQTNINGVRFSFTDLNVEGETAPQYGSITFFFKKGSVLSASWDATQDPGVVQGNNVAIVGRTNGYGVGTGSMEILASEADDWITLLSKYGTFPVMSVFFNLRFSYAVNGTDVRIDELQGIKITKVGAANARGNDATSRTFDFNIAQIYQAGIPLFEPAVDE